MKEKIETFQFGRRRRTEKAKGHRMFERRAELGRWRGEERRTQGKTRT